MESSSFSAVARAEAVALLRLELLDEDVRLVSDVEAEVAVRDESDRALLISFRALVRSVTP